VFIILLSKCKAAHDLHPAYHGLKIIRHCDGPDCLIENGHMLARTLQLFLVPDTICYESLESNSLGRDLNKNYNISFFF